VLTSPLHDALEILLLASKVIHSRITNLNLKEAIYQNILKQPNDSSKQNNRYQA
jgi:hypothetical protein